ncbi:MAG: hypothetical protein IPK10_17365 [Bacteroidetes bacterium]|nr:hypothetical protein [Bacteroidota bacterium]
MTTLPPYSIHEKHWNHDKNIVFLNHGSFGSCPTAILDLQTEIKIRTEQDPIKELVNDFEKGYIENKNALAQFVGCNPNDLVLMKNTTSGANTILNSLSFEPGDEILTHSHAYGACVNVLKYFAEKHKCKLVVAEIPFPISSEDEITNAILNQVTSKTKFVFWIISPLCHRHNFSC